MTLVCSETSPGIYTMKLVESIQCYSGFYFLHMLCSIIVGLIFVVICLIVALTFFECSDEEENLTAKYYIFFISEKIPVLILLCYFQKHLQQLFLVFFLTIVISGLKL